jgi:pimeloyl-ACP methyl ester carboxylesterase
VGHDHGGAVAQLLAAEHAGRVDRLVLSNAEAYDNWPSAEERPFVRGTQLPLFGALLLWLWSWKPLLGMTLISGKAVRDVSVLTPELLHGYARSNLGDQLRRAKTKRVLRGHLDSVNNRVTTDLLPGLRRFDHPTLLIWARMTRTLGQGG